MLLEVVNLSYSVKNRIDVTLPISSFTSIRPLWRSPAFFKDSLLLRWKWNWL